MTLRPSARQRQAGAAAKAHETNTAEGDAATPYRAPEEAAAAREAETDSRQRQVDGPMQSDPSQSEEMQALRHAQQRVLSQEEQEQHKRDIQNRDEFKRKQSQKPQEESEGESQ